MFRKLMKSLPKSFYHLTIMSNGSLKMVSGTYDAAKLAQGLSGHESSVVNKSITMPAGRASSRSVYDLLEDFENNPSSFNTIELCRDAAHRFADAWMKAEKLYPQKRTFGNKKKEIIVSAKGGTNA